MQYTIATKHLHETFLTEKKIYTRLGIIHVNLFLFRLSLIWNSWMIYNDNVKLNSAKLYHNIQIL